PLRPADRKGPARNRLADELRTRSVAASPGEFCLYAWKASSQAPAALGQRLLQIPSPQDLSVVQLVPRDDVRERPHGYLGIVSGAAPDPGFLIHMPEEKNGRSTDHLEL